jgi:hypothetical protein
MPDEMGSVKETVEEGQFGIPGYTGKEKGIQQLPLTEHFPHSTLYLHGAFNAYDSMKWYYHHISVLEG